MAQLRRLIALSVLAVLGLAGLGGCEVVAPTNAFDPDAPPETQATGTLQGSVVLVDPFDGDTRTAALQRIRVGLRDANGRKVVDEALGVELTRSLIDVDSDDGAGQGSGRFVIGDLVPGTYVLDISGAPSTFEAPALVPIDVGAGVTVDVDDLIFAFVGTGDDGPGLIEGDVVAEGGAAGQHQVSLFFRRGSDVTLHASVITDGAFRFASLPFGDYAVVAESEGFTPVYRLGVEVEEAGSSENAALAHTFSGDEALVVHPITAALAPALGVAGVVLDEDTLLCRNEALDVLVLPFAAAADVELGISGMRLSTSRSFFDADGVALPFTPHQAQAAVTLRRVMDRCASLASSRPAAPTTSLSLSHQSSRWT